MEDLEVQTDQNKENFNEVQLKMYSHILYYGVRIEPYVEDKFPKEYETHELFEVLGAYFTKAAKVLKELHLKEE